MTLRRTSQRSLSTTTRGLLQFGGGGAAPSYDTDAQTYITAVEAADGESLETGVKDAINAFVVGCKADGIWAAIKASCILAGARTLTGALVPLVGTAPTNNNFVSGDYSRTAGLTGNGSTKYLNSLYVLSQNNNHIGFYPTNLVSGSTARLISAANAIGNIAIFVSQGTSPDRLRSRNGTLSDSYFYTGISPGFTGISRSNASNYLERADGSASTVTAASSSIGSVTTAVFAENRAGSITGYTNATIAFYSLGEALDLALLDTRVTTLIADIGTALA